MAWGLPTPQPASTPAPAAPAPSAWGPPASSTPTVLPPEPSDSIDLFEGVEPVETVELEGVALLQILKHCHESLPSTASGTLLGLANDETKALEITNSFPSPSNAIERRRKDASDEYQQEMMKGLREVGADNNKVGWYTSASLGTFITPSIIDTCMQHQQALGPNALFLVYDTAETSKGSLKLRAFRLKQSFSEAYKAGAFAKDGKDKAKANTIFEELSLSLHNSELIECWLQGIVQTQESVLANGFDRLDLATNAYLENNLKQLSSYADELSQEQYKFQGYERAMSKQRASYQQWQKRQREENKVRRENGESLLPEEDPDYFKSLHQPPRLESLLLTKQMNAYCEQVNRYAGKSFQKLFLAAKFHQE